MNTGDNFERNQSQNLLTMKNETRSSFDIKCSLQDNGQTVAPFIPHMLKCLPNGPVEAGLFSPLSTADIYSSALPCGPPDDAALPGVNEAKPGAVVQLEKQMFVRRLLEMASSAPSLLPFLTFPLPPPQMAMPGQLPIQSVDIPSSLYANAMGLAKETSGKDCSQAAFNGLDSISNLPGRCAPQQGLVDVATTSMTMAAGTPGVVITPTTSTVTPTKEAASMNDSSSPEATFILNASIPALNSTTQVNEVDKIMMDKSLEQAGSIQQIASLLQLQNMPNIPPFFFPAMVPPTAPMTTVTSISQTFTAPGSSCGNNNNNNTCSYPNTESTRVKPTASGGHSGSSQKTEDDFCELCQKHFCNKYYLRKHKADVHGIYTEPHSHARRRETASYTTVCKSSLPSSGHHKLTFNSGPENMQMKSDEAFKMDVDERHTIFPQRQDSSAFGNNSFQAPPTVHLSSMVKSASAWTQQPEMSTKHQSNQALSNKSYDNNHHSSSTYTGNNFQFPDVPAIPPVGYNFPFPPILGIPTTRSTPSGPINSFESMLSAQYCMLALTGSLPQGVGPELTPQKPIDSDKHSLFPLPDLSHSPNGIHEVKCEQCQKIFCNQYFLQVHRANHHGAEAGQEGLENKSSTKYNSLDNREVSSMVRQISGDILQASSKQTNDNSYKDMTRMMHNVKSSSLFNSDSSICQDYKLKSGESHTVLNKGITPTSETSNSTAEFKPSGTTSLDAFKTSMVAAKLADRVTCDLCKKELCNKYFLRTHKIRVHGVSPRDVGGPPMRNPPVMTAPHHAAHSVSPLASVASPKAMVASMFNHVNKESKAARTSGSHITSGNQFLVNKPNFTPLAANTTVSMDANLPDFGSSPIDQLASLPSPFYPFPYFPMIPQLFQVTPTLRRDNDFANSIHQNTACDNGSSLLNISTNVSTLNELGLTNPTKMSTDSNCNSMTSLPCLDKQLPRFPTGADETMPSISSLLPGNESSVYCPLCEHSVGPRFLLPAHLTGVHNLSPTETSFFLYLLQAKPVLPECGESSISMTGLASSTMANVMSTWALAQSTASGTSERQVESQQPGTSNCLGESSNSMDEATMKTEDCIDSNPMSKPEPGLYTSLDQELSTRAEESGAKNASFQHESLDLQTLSCNFEAHQANPGWKGKFYADMQESLAQSLRNIIKTNPNPIITPSLPVLTQSIAENMIKTETSLLEKTQQIPQGNPYSARAATEMHGCQPSINQTAPLPLNVALGFMGLPTNQLDASLVTADAITLTEQRSSDEFNNDTDSNKGSPSFTTSSVSGLSWSSVLHNINTATTIPISSASGISPGQSTATVSSIVSPRPSSMTSGGGGMIPRKSPNQMRVLCDICNKWICNKYFLRTHKANKHGITESSQHFASLLTSNCKLSVPTSPSGQKYSVQPSLTNTVNQFQALNCTVSPRVRDNQDLTGKEVCVDIPISTHQDSYSNIASLPFNSHPNIMPTGLGETKSWLGNFDPQTLCSVTFPSLQTAIHDPVVMDHLTAVWKNKLNEVGSQLGSDVNNQERLQPPINQHLPFFPFGGNFFLPGTHFPAGSSVLPAPTSIVSYPSVSPSVQSGDKASLINQNILSSLGIFGESSGALDLCPKSQTSTRNTEVDSASPEAKNASEQCEANQWLRTPFNRLSFNCCESTKHSLPPTRTYSRPHRQTKRSLIYLASKYVRLAKRYRAVNSNVPQFINKSNWRRWKTKGLHGPTFGRASVARWRLKSLRNKKRVNSLIWPSKYQLQAETELPVGRSPRKLMNNQAEYTSALAPCYSFCSAQDGGGATILTSTRVDESPAPLHANNQKSNCTSTTSNARKPSQQHSFQISQLVRSSRDLEADDQTALFSSQEVSTVSAPGLNAKETSMHESSANSLGHRPFRIPLKAYRETLSTTM